MEQRAGLTLDGVVKRFADVVAVAGIELELPEGKLISFLGPSGCGKTTLLRMIAGLERPTEGRIRLQGEDITDKPPHTRDIGMVFQTLALFPHLDVARNVGYGLRIRGIDSGTIESRVRDLLALVSLEDVASRRISQLSGGQRQRVATALSRCSRSCSCWTSRCPRSMPTCAKSCRSSFGCCSRSSASRPSSSPTTRERR